MMFNEEIIYMQIRNNQFKCGVRLKKCAVFTKHKDFRVCDIFCSNDFLHWKRNGGSFAPPFSMKLIKWDGN